MSTFRVASCFPLQVSVGLKHELFFLRTVYLIFLLAQPSPEKLITGRIILHFTLQRVPILGSLHLLCPLTVICREGQKGNAMHGFGDASLNAKNIPIGHILISLYVRKDLFLGKTDCVL